LVVCVRLHVKVVPKASRNGVVGWVGDALKVCVTAAPERGRANEAVREVLAAALGVSERQVQIVSGATSARKVVEIEGLDEVEVRRKLEESLSQ
jgi:uncharacterized protein (TIGR00251 family)